MLNENTVEDTLGRKRGSGRKEMVREILASTIEDSKEEESQR